MGARGKRKAQVKTPAKMRAGVDSIPLAFEINVRTARSEAYEPRAERTALGAVGAPVLDNKKANKLPTQPARRRPARGPVVDNPAWLSRLGEGLRGDSVACSTPQHSALAGHRKSTH